MTHDGQYFVNYKLKLLQEKFNNGLDLELDEDDEVLPSGGDSEYPIPIRMIKEKYQRRTGFVDLSGAKVGDLTVLGMRKFKGGWVCRCVCGIYTVRKGRAIKNPSNDWDSCIECRKKRYEKKQR